MAMVTPRKTQNEGSSTTTTPYNSTDPLSGSEGSVKSLGYLDQLGLPPSDVPGYDDIRIVTGSRNLVAESNNRKIGKIGRLEQEVKKLKEDVEEGMGDLKEEVEKLKKEVEELQADVADKDMENAELRERLAAKEDQVKKQDEEPRRPGRSSNTIGVPDQYDAESRDAAQRSRAMQHGEEQSSRKRRRHFEVESSDHDEDIDVNSTIIEEDTEAEIVDVENGSAGGFESYEEEQDMDDPEDEISIEDDAEYHQNDQRGADRSALVEEDSDQEDEQSDDEPDEGPPVEIYFERHERAAREVASSDAMVAAWTRTESDLAAGHAKRSTKEAMSEGNLRGWPFHARLTKNCVMQFENKAATHAAIEDPDHTTCRTCFNCRRLCVRYDADKQRYIICRLPSKARKGKTLSDIDFFVYQGPQNNRQLETELGSMWH